MSVKKLAKEIIEKRKVPKTLTLDYKVIEELIKTGEENKISASILANEILKKVLIKNIKKQ